MESSVFFGIEEAVGVGRRETEVAGTATVEEEEMCWERTGRRERTLLEVERAGIEVWTAARVASPNSVRVGLDARQEDMIANWRKREKKKRRKWVGGQPI
jgi:hypothetical protein